MAEQVIIVCDLDKGAAPKQAVERFVVKSLMNGGREVTLDLCAFHRQQFLGVQPERRRYAKRRTPEEMAAQKAAVGDDQAARQAAVPAEARRKPNLTYGSFSCPEPECKNRPPFNTKQGLTLHTLRVHRGMNPAGDRKAAREAVRA